MRSAAQPLPGAGFVYAAWLTACIATLATLFLGEVMGLPICTLCWYQRIALYPIVVLLPAAILLRDRHLNFYAMPLLFAGLVVAVYHNLLYYRLIETPLTPCAADVPCTARQLELFGFLTIPMMSLLTFCLMLLLLVVFQKNLRKLS
jgi:disulfide bond formation protein DsbB